MINVWRTRGFVSSALQPIVYRCGEPRAHLLDGIVRFSPARRCEVKLLNSLIIASGLFGDAAVSEDGVCTGGHRVALPFPFPLLVGNLAANYSPPSRAPSQDTGGPPVPLGVDDLDFDAV